MVLIRPISESPWLLNNHAVERGRLEIGRYLLDVELGPGVKVDYALGEVGIGGVENAAVVHEGRIGSVEVEGHSVYIAGNRSGFLEYTSGGCIVPEATSSILRFWKFEIASRSVFENPAGVHGGTSLQYESSSIEA